MSDYFTQIHEPTWSALLRAIGEEQVVDWMYMFSLNGTGFPLIHAYKHQDTRCYVYLSDDGQFWARDGETFCPVTAHTATNFEETAMSSIPYISYTPTTEDEEIPIGIHILLLTPEVIAFLQQAQRDTEEITTAKPYIHRIHFDFPDIGLGGKTVPPLLRLPEDIDPKEVVGNIDRLLAVAESDHYAIASFNRFGRFVLRAELSYAVEYSNELYLDGDAIVA